MTELILLSTFNFWRATLSTAWH